MYITFNIFCSEINTSGQERGGSVYHFKQGQSSDFEKAVHHRQQILGTIMGLNIMFFINMREE